jgi:hypothetical protein
LSTIFEECVENLNSDCYREKILSAPSYNGIAGDIYFNGNKYSDRELVLYEYFEGDWVSYDFE